MKHLLLVFLGGGLGSGLRYAISRYLNPLLPHFYLGTFTVNIIGCLLIGVVFGLSMRNEVLSPAQTALFATGFCGGFTTFSSFSFEQLMLLREGAYVSFLGYTLASLVVGLLAVMLGLWISRLL